MIQHVGHAVMMLILALALTACNDRKEAADNKKLRVVATIFPVYDFARIVAGDRAEVQLLLPPGVEPHNYEPKPEEAVRISRADLFVYTDSYMEPWAGSLLRGIAAKDGPLVVEAGHGAELLPAADHGDEHGAGDHEKHGAMDPHIWLDPANARLMIANIASAFAQRDPANAATYKANAARYDADLAALDERFRNGLSSCRQRTFLHGGHFAFAYLAKRYGLAYRSAYGVSAEAEPTPRQLVGLVREMRERHLRYIFSEELLSPAVAETIARETGATVLKLNGIHNVGKADLDKGVSYLSLMEENLKSLRTGLECH
ncbi:MAG TPA: metal ABC transporter substrate-binding protein [Geobacteraceae bacterium]